MDDRNEIKFATGIREPPLATEAVESVRKILDAKYTPVTSDQILDNSPHFTECQKKSLRTILQKHAKLFDALIRDAFGTHSAFLQCFLVQEE